MVMIGSKVLASVRVYVEVVFVFGTIRQSVCV